MWTTRPNFFSRLCRTRALLRMWGGCTKRRCRRKRGSVFSAWCSHRACFCSRKRRTASPSSRLCSRAGLCSRRPRQRAAKRTRSKYQRTAHGSFLPPKTRTRSKLSWPRFETRRVCRRRRRLPTVTSSSARCFKTSRTLQDTWTTRRTAKSSSGALLCAPTRGCICTRAPKTLSPSMGSRCLAPRLRPTARRPI
eukprot:Amastigsp_a174811_5.p2 type:complete len:194 gc:universal Amastigsp_a174811_5:290-871(+)